jgi:hypothetical protein
VVLNFQISEKVGAAMSARVPSLALRSMSGGAAGGGGDATSVSVAGVFRAAHEAPWEAVAGVIATIGPPGFDVRAREGGSRDTLLHVVAGAGSLPGAQWLIAAGADADAVNATVCATAAGAGLGCAV